ncbi:tripartite tricarboxylate transporter substrate binding protein [Roseomonas sp. NAR14]|uniref:Tripartite tricarboxylate transporter substrate binding protein n=1 Tax=Roseomonas acroporae TaxID=2937791 RepID=A0A9X1YD71_9PROT|nr:tripartite tricarboxylate transporter substrate binding protein [Roseomonas acroporae]MCK8787986.1 tripartite tricarboxylate transporter substrate binding protein [Roseomonas acroporae]
MYHRTAPRRRALLAVPLAIAASAVLAQPQTSAWPSRPVMLVVPFAAGASPDVVARVLAERLAATWGQPVVVQNLPGASSTIGVERVARSVPDGYTLGLTGDGAMVVRVSMDPPPPYDSWRDLAPISLLVRTRNVLVVHPSVPAATLAELVALAKARPSSLAYGHSGVGFSTHLGMEMLKQAAGIDITAVPYANEGAMFTDLMQGRVQVMIGSGPAIIRRVQAGEVRALAVTSRDRAPVLPDVPTIAESGFPGFEAVAWFGLIAPAQTPPAILARVQQDTVAAMAEPATHRRLDELGLVVVGNSQAEFAALIPQEIERMAGVLRPLGLLRTR